MFIRNMIAATSCVLLVGCVVLPVERNDGISIQRVTERVKCELGQALSLNSELLSWAGVIILTLEIDNAGSVLPSATFLGPVGAGTYAVDVSAGLSAKSVQTSLVNVYFPVYDLVASADKCPPEPWHPLEDRLGLKEWVARALDLKNSGGLFRDKDKAIGYTVEFDLEISAGATPGFNFARVTDKTGLSISRKQSTR